MQKYCWPSLIIVLTIAFMLMTFSSYIKGVLELDSSNASVAMGMFFICALLVVKTLPFMACRVQDGMIKTHCYNLVGMDWMSVSLLFATLIWIKLVWRKTSTFMLGKNLEIDSTVLIMTLAYVAWFFIMPPLDDGRGKRAGLMPWLSNRKAKRNVMFGNQQINL